MTGFTLYVIPSWATHEFTTQASITDAAGQSIATTTFKHRYRMYQQLFLLFGMPFAGVESVYDEMWTAVMQDVAVWTVESVRAP